MKKKIIYSLMFFIMISMMSCSSIADKKPINESSKKNDVAFQNKEDSTNIYTDKTGHVSVDNIKNKYKDSIVNEWGEKITGVITKIDTDDNIIALTFDACGGKGGSEYDEKLINYLIKENIPATLFINARWIDENLDTFKILSKNPLFEIENHGSEHKPLSTNGKSVYNINGTKNIEDAINEVYINEQKIKELTGRKPLYFRSGTAYYDNIAVNIVKELGEKPVNFDVIGDAGATFSINQIKTASLKAKQGSIIIYHMNHPKKSTAEGLMEVIPLLKEKKFSFVKLEDYDKLLK